MADLIKVSIQGDLPGGEKWSVNPVYNIGGDFGGVDVTTAQLNTIVAAIGAVTVPTNLLTNFAQNTRVVGYRIEARTKAGTLQGIAEFVRPTPANGSSTVVHGFTPSFVSSLRTASAGASARGRLYWPATGVPLDLTTYRLAGTGNNVLAVAVNAYLASIRAAIDVTLDGVSLVVWSRKNANTIPVTSIQVGDIIDTQRRRRDTLIEAYASVAVT